MKYLPLSDREEMIGKIVVNACYKIHTALGPGLLEKVYELCLNYELQKAGLRVQRQLPVPIHYEGITFEEGLRLDLLIEDMVICELKAVEQVNPVREAQILSHLETYR